MDKNLFENLNFSQKLQLYFIVPMVFWLLLLLLENYIIQDTKKDIENKLTTIDISTHKIEKVNISEMIYQIQSKGKDYNLKTKSIQRKEKAILVEFDGDYTNILGFLQKIKLHYEIFSFEVLKEKNLTRLHLTINNQYFFNKDSVNKEFNTAKKTIINKVIKQVQIKLEAIIDNEVLIDGLWYKKGETYKQNKIIDIKRKFIKLQNKATKKVVKMELFNEPL